MLEWYQLCIYIIIMKLQCHRDRQSCHCSVIITVNHDTVVSFWLSSMLQLVPSWLSIMLQKCHHDCQSCYCISSVIITLDHATVITTRLSTILLYLVPLWLRILLLQFHHDCSTVVSSSLSIMLQSYDECKSYFSSIIMRANQAAMVVCQCGRHDKKSLHFMYIHPKWQSHVMKVTVHVCKVFTSSEKVSPW
jgi:hypothetical protein